MPLELTMTNEDAVDLAVSPVTKSGAPSAIQPGTLAWEMLAGQDSGATLVVTDAGCTVKSGDNLGDVLVQASADADLGDGVVTIMDTALIHVQGAMATNLGMTANVHPK